MNVSSRGKVAVDPKAVPIFPLSTQEFALHTSSRGKGLFIRQLNARDLYAKLMRKAPTGTAG